MVSYLGATIYDWLFTKCFHEELQYVLKGITNSAAFPSGRRASPTPLDVFQMILCPILAIRNFFSIERVSRIRNTEVSSVSWGVLIVGRLPSWWASGFEDLCIYEDWESMGEM